VYLFSTHALEIDITLHIVTFCYCLGIFGACRGLPKPLNDVQDCDKEPPENLDYPQPLTSDFWAANHGEDMGQKRPDKNCDFRIKPNMDSHISQDKTIAKPPFSEKGGGFLGGFWGVSGEIPNS
jgi:hypothetical protein